MTLTQKRAVRQLNAFTTAMNQNAPDTPAYFEQQAAYHKFLFTYLTLQNYDLVTRGLGHAITTDELATLMVGVYQHLDPTYVLKLPVEVKHCYALRGLRMQFNMSYQDVATLVGWITPKQVERAEIGTLRLSKKRWQNLLQTLIDTMPVHKPFHFEKWLIHDNPYHQKH